MNIVGATRRGRLGALLISLVAGLLAIGSARAQTADGDTPPLPVGTTVDLSVATVGPIRDVAVADKTYVAVEDNGLWVLQADGKRSRR